MIFQWSWSLKGASEGAWAGASEGVSVSILFYFFGSLLLLLHVLNLLLYLVLIVSLLHIWNVDTGEIHPECEE